MPGLQILQRLRDEPFNKATERILESHPYIRAAEDGTLTLSQRRAFAHEQYSIQFSDAISFAFLAGHRDFAPRSLAGVSVPEQPSTTGTSSSSSSEGEGGATVDLFQFLLGGEVYAAPLLLAYAKSVGLDEDSLRQHQQHSASAQAYPSYWARLAMSNKRAAAAAACAVNFPAWGAMCGRLLESLGSSGGDGGKEYNYANGVDDEGLAFIKFFATPIEELDMMAAAVLDEEDVSYEDLVEPVRLLQQYEIMFWDAIFEQK
mmetsp:Transcript_31211/g.65287  ORF Transcript_31211/g.65287 Transcript_31211/m.65287 type:complete len:260 (+) Transcript_31211:124-903(+)